MVHTVVIDCWAVRLSWEDGRRHYFATEELAQLGAAWAFSVRWDAIRANPRLRGHQVYPHYSDGSSKLVWWEEGPQGLVCHKEYAMVDHDVLERRIVE